MVLFLINHGTPLICSSLICDNSVIFVFCQVLNPYSPYLDDEKHLGVRLLIANANEVYDPLLINSDKHSVAKLREMNAQTKAVVENFW